MVVHYILEGSTYGKIWNVSTKLFKSCATAHLEVWEGLVVKVIGVFGIWELHVGCCILISFI